MPAQTCSVVLAQKSHKVFSHFMPSQAVIKQRLFAHFDEKTAWQAWGAMDDVMAAFQALSTAPVVDVVDEVMPIIFLSDKSAWIKYDCTHVPAPLGK